MRQAGNQTITRAARDAAQETSHSGIRVRGLVKTWGETRVLDGVDLDVGRGQVVALLGPNGAGKTTTVNILTGLVPPDSGTVEVAGVDVVADPVTVRSRQALTGQSAAVDGLLTGEENLRMMARLWGLTAAQSRERAARLLTEFDLLDSARRQVRTYSGGMRRRLDLAISLVRRPEVLFLDEPTTGLDTRSRRAVWDIVEGLARAGTTVLLTTQYLEEADRLADRVVVLDGGRVVAEGTPDELKARVGGEVVELVAASGEVVTSARTDGTLEGLRSAVAELSATGLVGEVELRRPSLDDVFLTLTGGGSR
ncbi:daunorubicin resistance protein DrrA family ABC transporter ATP-binding protein [Intrasporangium mesophilum]